MTRPPFWMHATVVVTYATLITIGLFFFGRYVTPLTLLGSTITSLILGMQGANIWIAFWKRRAKRRLLKDVEKVYELVVEFKHGACPDCGSTLFNPGPRGGKAHNIRCAECGSKFWYSPPFPALRLLDSEDQFYNLSVSRTLDYFT